VGAGPLTGEAVPLSFPLLRTAPALHESRTVTLIVSRTLQVYSKAAIGVWL